MTRTERNEQAKQQEKQQEKIASFEALAVKLERAVVQTTEVLEQQQLQIADLTAGLASANQAIEQLRGGMGYRAPINDPMADRFGGIQDAFNKAAAE